MKILKNLIVILLVILLSFVLYSKYIKQDKIIKMFGKACFIVATGSMEPKISMEEFIVIAEQEKYEVGDIVTYIDEDGFIITHRIIEINSNTFISKGDSNNIKDAPCDINRIQGKIIFHSKILGFFILYLLKPICVLYVLIIIIIEISKSLKKEEKSIELVNK